MRSPANRLFLGRAAYRQRRLLDAARILPVIFALLATVPPLWMPDRFSFALGTIWLAVGWFSTILATALLHHLIEHRPPSERDDDAA